MNFDFFNNYLNAMPEKAIWSLLIVAIYSLILPAAISIFNEKVFIMHFFYGLIKIPIKGFFVKIIAVFFSIIIIYLIYEVTIDTMPLNNITYNISALTLFITCSSLSGYLIFKKKNKKSAKRFK